MSDEDLRRLTRRSTVEPPSSLDALGALERAFAREGAPFPPAVLEARQGLARDLCAALRELEVERLTRTSWDGLASREGYPGAAVHLRCAITIGCSDPPIAALELSRVIEDDLGPRSNARRPGEETFYELLCCSAHLRELRACAYPRSRAAELDGLARPSWLAGRAVGPVRHPGWGLLTDLSARFLATAWTSLGASAIG